MKIQKSDNVYFNAQQVAMAKVKLPTQVVNYDIYKISSKDDKYLDSLKSKLDLKKLWTNLRQEDYDIWHFITDRALTMNSSFRFGYLLMEKDKPCGAMNGDIFWDKCYLNYLSTWPIETNKKMPLAGKTLMLNLFKTLLKTEKISSVTLNAVKEDPFRAFLKYKSLNFKPCGGNGDCETMKIQRGHFAETIDHYKDLVEIIPVEGEEFDMVERFGV